MKCVNFLMKSDNTVFNVSAHEVSASVGRQRNPAQTTDIFLPPPSGLCFRPCLPVCSLATLRKNFRRNVVPESFREGWQLANEQLIKFCWRSGSPSGYRDCFPDSSLLGDTESGNQPTALRNAAEHGMQ